MPGLFNWTGISQIRPELSVEMSFFWLLPLGLKGRVRLIAPRESRFFLLPAAFANEFIQRDLRPAIPCPSGPDKLFSIKFGMKSAIIGLGRHEAQSPLPGIKASSCFSPGLKMGMD
jgi:hypothetical protein